MSVPAVSGPKGLAPYISSRINTLTEQGHKIERIRLELKGLPYVQEGELLLAYVTHSNVLDLNFAAFNKDSCSEKVVKILKEFTETLKKDGCFAELAYEAEIDSSLDLKIWTKTITGKVQGFLNGQEWQDNLFSSEPAPLP